MMFLWNVSSFNVDAHDDLQRHLWLHQPLIRLSCASALVPPPNFQFAERGIVMKNEQIKEELTSRRPYQAWLERSINHVSTGRSGLGQIMSYKTLMNVMQPLDALSNAGQAPVPPALQAAAEQRVRVKKAFGYSKEVGNVAYCVGRRHRCGRLHA